MKRLFSILLFFGIPACSQKPNVEKEIKPFDLVVTTDTSVTATTDVIKKVEKVNA